MPSESVIDKMLAAKRAMIPRKGYNLVGLDDYEKPGEELYLIAHFATRRAAEKEKAARERENPDGDRMFIYGPKDG